MGMLIIRLFFLALGSLSGFYVVWVFGGHPPVGILAGLGVSTLILSGEYALTKVSLSRVLGGFGGLLVGVAAAGVINLVTRSVWSPQFLFAWDLLTVLLLGYLGLTCGIRLGGNLSGLGEGGFSVNSSRGTHNKILDTSVIIDGRIADLCETGFLEGTFVVPQFILQELQHIADSPDSIKRARGRRGLEILHRVQKMAGIDNKIVDEDFPHLKDVDSKIVALAKKVNAKIVTNDLNLNKVAELQGVKVLNINELCNALKPAVLPGESMRVFVLKEGKEAGQGVAYLDDGTMIVVDDAKKWIGKNVDVVVTSVLQTAAGRMIFTRLKEEQEKEEYHYARG